MLKRPPLQKRFKSIYEAVKARYPKITLIGNVGLGCPMAMNLKGDGLLPGNGACNGGRTLLQRARMVSEASQRYDCYDRGGSKVFVSEYAAHDTGRRTNTASALAEAAYMTSLERNSDNVQMAFYAPNYSAKSDKPAGIRT
jgi:endo-alpha-1,4-polygalactosaminidase (GH114 family)